MVKVNQVLLFELNTKKKDPFEILTEFNFLNLSIFPFENFEDISKFLNKKKQPQK